MTIVAESLDLESNYVDFEEQKPDILTKFSDNRCYTLIADADWTLYNAASYQDTFDTSPAKEEILEWIRLGIKTNALGQKVFTHQLIVTTGGDFTALKDRFVEFVPEDVKPAVTLVSNTGARLFYFDVNNHLIEDTYYTTHAIQGGVVLSSHIQEEFIAGGVDLLNCFFEILKQDTTLQKETLEAPYGNLVIEAMNNYPDQGISLEEFKNERVLHGIYKNLSLMPRIEIRELQKDRTVQVSIIGIFSNLPSLIKYPNFQKLLSKLDCYTSCNLTQNLCVLEIAKTNKGTTLEYLRINPEASCGIGDSPDSNDKPLSQYRVKKEDGSLVTMPFISVDKKTPKNADQFVHIGDRVEGTKAFLRQLIQEQKIKPYQNFLDSVYFAQEAIKRSS